MNCYLYILLQDINVFESESNEKMETIEDLFPVDCRCFMLANPHYGCSGKVLEVDMKQGRVRVQLTVPPEPDIASISKNHHVSHKKVLVFSLSYHSILCR